MIGAVLIPGASAPKLVRRDMIAAMKRGAVVVDVAIDQGGCFETSHATTHTDPVYFVDGVLHYCVSNMPAAVPHTSTFALTNATFPYLLELANHGLEAACERQPGHSRGRQHLQRPRHAPRRGGIAGTPLARAQRRARRTCRPVISHAEAPRPLTALTEEEKMFQATVRRVRPRTSAPARPRDGRSAASSAKISCPVLRPRPDGHRDPRGIRRPGRQLLPGRAGRGRAGRSRSFRRRHRRRAEYHRQQRHSSLGQARAEGQISAAPGGRYGRPRSRFRKPAPDRTPSPLATRADDRGDHYLLNGRKLWITNAAEAGLFLSSPTPDPEAGYKGITRFLVERGFPGFQVGKKEDKLGIRASSTCELILDDCRVPRENVLGEVGKGYKIAIETLNEGRIAIGAQMIGLAQGALEHATAYAKQRKQFGKPIADFQGVQFELAEMADRGRSRAPAGLQRRPLAGRRPALPHRSRDGQIFQLRDRRDASLPRRSKSTAALASPRIIRWRSFIATPRSAGSTKAPATSNC